MIAGFVALAALMVGLLRDVKGDIRDVRNDNWEIRQDFGRRLDDLQAETREQFENQRTDSHEQLKNKRTEFREQFEKLHTETCEQSKNLRLLDDAAKAELARKASEGSGYGRFSIYHTGIHSGEQYYASEEGRAQFRLTHEIGQNATIYPDDVGVVLPGGSELRFTVHLYASGAPTPVRADVGFKLHPAGYRPKYESWEFSYVGGIGDALDIPAGEDDYAPLLPKGAVLHLTGWYDNTEKNRNVVDPRNWKGHGQRSIDDMLVLLAKLTFLNDEQYAELAAEREAQRKREAAGRNQ